MIFIFIFVSVLLSSLPVLHSTTHDNISMTTCPASFSCSGLGSFKYPFYNASDAECGLIQLNCTSKGGEVQFGGRSYEIAGKFNSDHSPDILLIRNRTFEQLVNNKSCEALMNNLSFPSPSPLLYSSSLTTFITLFKCTKNLTSSAQQETKQTDDYFYRQGYKSNNTCKDYIFYYDYSNGTVPSDLPQQCQVIQLPVQLSSTTGLDETNIFSLLSYIPTVLFQLSPTCADCYKNGHWCDTKNGQVVCSDAIKERESKEPTPLLDREKRSREQSLLKVLVIVGSVVILTLSFVIIFMIWRHCKNKRFSYVSSKKKSPHLEDISLSCGVTVFSYKELEDAINNFDPSRELGGGGFGAVYYGKLQDGREVAVKKLHEHNYNRVQQFINEVEILTKLRHPNLVVLYGFTSRQSSELLLVYEHIPNGTVADHLHGELANPNLLTWPIRMNIAIETASALVYLHASEIIHRDVKTNNILLDHNFSVKVADFGLSRLIPNDVTHVSTAPQGTPGYVDPQYHQRYQLTDKSDVFSFGVVLIELISSMVAFDLSRSQDEISLANLALNRIQRGAVDQLIDPVLDKNPKIMNMITLVAELAFRCLQHDSEMRPTMNEVLDALIDIQSIGQINSHDSIKDLQTMNEFPLSETNDAVVLLKDFKPSPDSVNCEWHSNNSTSTTLSSNGDRLLRKNDIKTYKPAGTRMTGEPFVFRKS